MLYWLPCNTKPCQDGLGGDIVIFPDDKSVGADEARLRMSGSRVVDWGENTLAAECEAMDIDPSGQFIKIVIVSNAGALWIGTAEKNSRADVAVGVVDGGVGLRPPESGE